MRQSLLVFPDEFLDAARVDGASELGFLLRVVLPNVVPAMTVLGVLTYQAQCDDPIWPLLVVQSGGMKTIPHPIAALTEEKHSNDGATVALPLSRASRC